MLERHSVLADQVTRIKAKRDAVVARANAIADKKLEPLLAEQALIAEKVEPWWKRAAAKLLAKDRKSMELGGCSIGTRKGADALGTPEDPRPVVQALAKLEWARPLLVVTTALDKAAVLKSLDGVYKEQLKQLGLKRVVGEDAFFIKRAKVQGART